MPAEDRADPTRLNASSPDATSLDATLVDANLVDATLLDAVAARMTRASVDALEASHDLLAHYPDTGDFSTQRAVDTVIDQAAESLGALTDSLSRASSELMAAVERATRPPTGESSPAKAGRRSPARAGRRRGLIA
ncbi:MAG: hypothetical protein ABIP19_11345 [Dermatophilaceae bacterium]